jgi:hypothetical protein
MKEARNNTPEKLTNPNPQRSRDVWDEVLELDLASTSNSSQDNHRSA